MWNLRNFQGPKPEQAIPLKKNIPLVFNGTGKLIPLPTLRLNSVLHIPISK